MFMNEHHADHHNQNHSQHPSSQTREEKKSVSPAHQGAMMPGHAQNNEKHHQHDKHAGHHTEDFLKRFGICVVITIPVLLLSHMIQQWIGFELKFRGDKYLLLTLGTVIYLYGGMPFFKRDG